MRTVHALGPGGLVRDWLSVPAWSAPCDDLELELSATGSPWGPEGRWVLTNGPDVAPLKARLYQHHALLAEQPLPEVVEGGAVSWSRSKGDAADTAHWQRVHVPRDGLLDWSQFSFTPEYRHALAATVLEVDQPEYRELEVACTGPFVLFVGGRAVLSGDEFGYMDPVRSRCRVLLPSGATEVQLATWQVAFREVRHVASLRVLGLPVRVVIPSPDADERPARQAEQLLDSVAITPWAVTSGVATLTGPVGARLAVTVGGGVPRPVVLEPGGTALDLASAGEAATGSASMLATGEVDVSVSVPGAPLTRTLRVARVPDDYRPVATGGPADWRNEVLSHVAAGRPCVARALARHELGPPAQVSDADLEPALHMIDARCDCADFEAVSLVHAWRRLPDWSEAQRDRVRTALLGFKYWIDQPGLDAMCYFTENHQFVWHTAELLIGELFPDATFPNAGWTGAQHAAHGAEHAHEWLRRKLRGGFSEFDSNAYLAIDALALVSLVEFAQDRDIRASAEALLDKTLFTLAANSWRGIHGAAHGRSYVPTLRSSRFEETGPIMRLLWGAGALNAAVLPATALATASVYSAPPLVRAVAQQPPNEWHGQQAYRGEYRGDHDLLVRPYDSDLHVWRTPDAMLSSVQDYRSGLPGLQEHVWGATLGPEVQVFATEPAAASIGSSARPNAWAGQRVLPRARQHRDTVLAVHPPGSRTHLWFPTPHLDEWCTAGSWLVGRVGNGFVAVAADGGFVPERRGDECSQAWWPRGPADAYVAVVARGASCETFAAGLGEPTFDRDPDGGAVVSWGGLELPWTGSFLVEGVSPDLQDGGLAAPPHLDNPACHVPAGGTTLRAEWAGERLVLDLDSGLRVEPVSGLGP